MYQQTSERALCNGKPLDFLASELPQAAGVTSEFQIRQTTCKIAALHMLEHCGSLSCLTNRLTSAMLREFVESLHSSALLQVFAGLNGGLGWATKENKNNFN